MQSATQVEITQSLESVQFTNLLSISWLQEKISKNFSTIVQYLKRQKAKNQDVHHQTTKSLSDLAKIDTTDFLTHVEFNNFLNETLPTNFVSKDQLEKLKTELLPAFSSQEQGQQPSKKSLSKNSVKAMSSPEIDGKLAEQNQLEKRIKDLEQRMGVQEERQRLHDAMINKESDRLNKNFEDHDLIRKEIQTKIKQGLDKIAPQINTLLSKAQTMNNLEDKINELSKIADTNLSLKIVDLTEKVSFLQDKQKQLKDQHSDYTKRNDSIIEGLMQFQKDMADEREQILARLKALQGKQQNTSIQLNDTSRKTDEMYALNIDGELRLLKERVADLETSVLTGSFSEAPTSAPTSSSSSAGDNAAYSRLVEKINKINMNLFNYATKEDLGKQINALRNRWQQSQRKLEKESELAEKRNEEIWAFLKELDNKKQNNDNHQLEEQLKSIKEDINLKNTINQKRTEQLQNRCHDLNKELFILKEELENQKMQQQNTIFNMSTTKLKEDATTKEAISSIQRTPSSGEDFRRQFQNKLHDLKIELINIMRDMQRRLQGFKNFDNELINLLNRFEQLKTSLGKKADQLDTKKQLQYLEGKLYGLYALLQKDESGMDDARIARKNWFCLSCDRILNNYSGKMGKQVIWDSMPSRKLIFNNSRKEELPSLKRPQ